MRRLLLALVLISGCMEVPSKVPPVQKIVPPVPASNELLSVAVEADETVISTLYKYSGGSNAISLRSPLSLQFGDTGLSLPAGSNLSYNLTELGGTIDFGSPKPIVSTKVLGATVHPILDRIVLRQPNIATAYARDMFGITHTQQLELPELGKPAVVFDQSPDEEPEPVPDLEPRAEPEHRTEPVSSPPQAAVPETKVEPTKPLSANKSSDRPKLYFWSINWNGGSGYCPHCESFKTDVKSYGANHGGKLLPFQVIADPKGFGPFSETRPCFLWLIDHRVYRQVGYSGLDALLKAFEKSQNIKKMSVAEMVKYNGPTTGVIGMSVRYHLLNHHDFTPEQLTGLTDDQLSRLHSACHRNGD